LASRIHFYFFLGLFYLYFIRYIFSIINHLTTTTIIIVVIIIIIIIIIASNTSYNSRRNKHFLYQSSLESQLDYYQIYHSITISSNHTITVLIIILILERKHHGIQMLMGTELQYWQLCLVLYHLTLLTTMNLEI